MSHLFFVSPEEESVFQREGEINSGIGLPVHDSLTNFTKVYKHCLYPPSMLGGIFSHFDDCVRNFEVKKKKKYDLLT